LTGGFNYGKIQLTKILKALRPIWQFKSDSIAAKKGVTKLSIKDVPEGEYALAIFYDENGNDKLDTNWLGIPKEKVAFSNAKMKTFGPPKFKECAFKLSTDTKINVSF